MPGHQADLDGYRRYPQPCYLRLTTMPEADSHASDNKMRKTLKVF